MDLTPGTSALVIGGDARAAAQVATLLAAEAVVTVVAPTATASIEDLADRGLITWHAREADMSDIDQAGIVLTEHADRTAPDRILESGVVTLVGGGPGDPGLVTVAGREAIENADVIVTDRLAPLAALAWARPDAEIIDVAKIPGGRSTSQDEINQLLVEHAKSG
jgi:uroporphyrin-III C-methyltransferase